MKCLAVSQWLAEKSSLPVRGAWVEMLTIVNSMRNMEKSLPVRGAWVEISNAVSWSRL